MRKFKLLLISVLFPCMCMGEGAYHEDNEFIIRAGFTGSHLRYKDNIGGTVNVSYIPFEINSCGILQRLRIIIVSVRWVRQQHY